MNAPLEFEHILICLLLLRFLLNIESCSDTLAAEQWFLQQRQVRVTQCGCFRRTEPCHTAQRRATGFPSSASLCWVLICPQFGQLPQSQDAGIARVYGPPWGGKSQHRGPAKPTECQQPQHGHPQQVQSGGDGCSQPGTTLCSECAFLQWAKHEDRHEV